GQKEELRLREAASPFARLFLKSSYKTSVEAGVAIMLLNATNAMSTSVPGKLRNAIAAHSAALRMLVALAKILRFACFDPAISQPKIKDPAIRQDIAANVLTPIRLVAFDCSKNVMSIHAAKNNRAE